MKPHLQLLTLSKMPRWFRRIFKPYWLGYEEGLRDGIWLGVKMGDRVEVEEIDDQDS